MSHREDDLAELAEAGRRAAAEAPPMTPETAARLWSAVRRHRRARERVRVTAVTRRDRGAAEAAESTGITAAENTGITARVAETPAAAPPWTDARRQRIAALFRAEQA